MSFDTPAALHLDESAVLSVGCRLAVSKDLAGTLVPIGDRPAMAAMVVRWPLAWLHEVRQ